MASHAWGPHNDHLVLPQALPYNVSSKLHLGCAVEPGYHALRKFLTRTPMEKRGAGLIHPGSWSSIYTLVSVRLSPSLSSLQHSSPVFHHVDSTRPLPSGLWQWSRH